MRTLFNVMADACDLTLWQCIVNPVRALRLVRELAYAVRQLQDTADVLDANVHSAHQEVDALRLKLSKAEMRNFWTGRNLEN